MENVNPALGECLKSQGLEFEEDGTWLKPKGQEHVIRARLFDTEMEDIHRLGIQMPFSDGRLLTESFLCKAETSEEAMTKGIGAFEKSALPAISAAFFGRESEENLTKETWETKDGPLTAWIGEMAFHGENDEAPEVPESLLPTLKDLVHDRHHARHLHWLRLVVVQRDGEWMTEVLWDNEVWREAEAAIQHLDWEATEAFSSFRLFVACHFNPKADSELDEEDLPGQAESFLATLFHLPIEDQTDEMGLLDLLNRMGFEGEYVRRALQIVPIALGRQLLADHELDFSDTWIELDGEGEELDSGHLSDDPIYNEAMALDQDAIGRSFGLYATNSIEVEAFNKAFESEDETPWTAPPVLIFRDPPTEAGMARGEAIIDAHAQSAIAAMEAESKKAKPAKPWWKFW